MNQFQKWAEEINKDWIGGYVATATDESLSVTLNGSLAAEVDKRFKVTGTDEDAIDQLTHMTNR